MRKKFEWIIKESKLPWLELDIQIPRAAMLKEAVALKDRFNSLVFKSSNYYLHKNWHSICLFGIDDKHHHHQKLYFEEANKNLQWTAIAKLCPVTTNFFKNVFPMNDYIRVSFMLLEPDGYISPHKDIDGDGGMFPINIALTNPKGCAFKMVDFEGFIPFSPGKSFLLDVGYEHTIVNKSNEDRYHLIVQGHPTDKYKELVEQSYEKNGY